MVDDPNSISRGQRTVRYGRQRLLVRAPIQAEINSAPSQVTAVRCPTNPSVFFWSPEAAANQHVLIPFLSQRCQEGHQVSVSDSVCAALVDNGARNSVVFDRAEPERVAEIDRVAAGKPVQIEAPGQADRILLRKPRSPCNRILLEAIEAKPPG